MGAVLTVLVVAGFYLRGIWKSRGPAPQAQKIIPKDVLQSASGFNLSKYDGPRKLFTIHAKSVEQYKEGGRAALHDVSIIVYGRNQDRSDQIYGSDFAYDPVAKEFTAQGDVSIDLEANSPGASAPGQPPAPETRNLIHVKTSGLTFSEMQALLRPVRQLSSAFLRPAARPRGPRTTLMPACSRLSPRSKS